MRVMIRPRLDRSGEPTGLRVMQASNYRQLLEFQTGTGEARGCAAGLGAGKSNIQAPNSTSFLKGTGWGRGTAFPGRRAVSRRSWQMGHEQLPSEDDRPLESDDLSDAFFTCGHGASAVPASRFETGWSNAENTARLAPIRLSCRKPAIKATRHSSATFLAHGPSSDAQGSAFCLLWCLRCAIRVQSRGLGPDS